MTAPQTENPLERAGFSMRCDNVVADGSQNGMSSSEKSSIGGGLLDAGCWR